MSNFVVRLKQNMPVKLTTSPSLERDATYAKGGGLESLVCAMCYRMFHRILFSETRRMKMVIVYGTEHTADLMKDKFIEMQGKLPPPE